MMHGYVVFDNNAYKKASANRLTRITKAERENGIIALASIAVLQEMLARVRDTDDKQRGRNRAAIWKLGQHCLAEREGQPVVNFVSHTDSQVYRLLSGTPHPDDKETFDRFGDMVRVVSQATPDDKLAEIAEELSAIEQAVATAESAYVARLDRAAKHDDAEANEMKRNLDYAARLTRRVEALYGHEFTPGHIVTKLVDIMRFTSVGFALQDSVIAEVRRSGGGHAQHKNTVWDEEIVSSTSMYTTINGKSLLVVTGEDRLIAAAAKAKAQDRLVNLAVHGDSFGATGVQGRHVAHKLWLRHFIVFLSCSARLVHRASATGRCAATGCSCGSIRAHFISVALPSGGFRALADLSNRG